MQNREHAGQQSLLRDRLESCVDMVDWRHESTDTTDPTDAQALSQRSA